MSSGMSCRWSVRQVPLHPVGGDHAATTSPTGSEGGLDTDDRRNVGFRSAVSDTEISPAARGQVRPSAKLGS
jgi:hypothetical protein